MGDFKKASAQREEHMIAILLAIEKLLVEIKSELQHQNII